MYASVTKDNHKAKLAVIRDLTRIWYTYNNAQREILSKTRET